MIVVVNLCTSKNGWQSYAFRPKEDGTLTHSAATAKQGELAFNYLDGGKHFEAITVKFYSDEKFVSVFNRDLPELGARVQLGPTPEHTI